MVKQIPGGGTAKKYLIYHNSRNKSRSKERFSVFCSSSQGLSNDITFTIRFKIKTRFSDVNNYDVII